MIKVLKISGIALALLTLFIIGFYLINNEPLPKGETGTKADLLASKILKSINHEAFEETKLLEWSFRGKNKYKWYKQKNIVEVSWDNHKVILNTKNPKKSEAFTDNKKNNDTELITKALNYFNNDSFWLVAPHKIYDNGVTRSLVNYNNKEALLVTYNSGGSTPGDSYLWIVDENGMPTDFKMWVKIIPIGGIGATWNKWKETKAGIKLPTEHELSLLGLKINMGNVQASN